MSSHLDLKNSLSAKETYDVVVVGAGISGVLFAHQSYVKGSKVCIVDKARGSGGRLSAKRIVLTKENMQQQVVERDSESKNYEELFIGFDLGCSEFEVQDPELKKLVSRWRDESLVSELEGSKYQPKKRSSFLTRSLLTDIDTKFSTRITRIDRQGNCWFCYSSIGGEEVMVLSAKRLVLAMPAPQVASLIPMSPYKVPVQSVQYQPQWVVMAALPAHIELDKLEDEVFFNGDVAGISCDSDKKGRQVADGLKTWVIHFSAQWTRKHIDWDQETVQNHVKEMLEKMSSVATIYAHRWLYSQVQSGMHTLDGTLKLDEGLYAIGDWLRRKGQSASLGGVEAAILSSHRLLDALESGQN